MALRRINHLDETMSNCFAATQACEECVEECERHDADHCQVCAEVLRDCAESCREMAS